MLLSLQSVNVFIGTLHVLRDINLEIKRGEAVFLVGRNGAGKSSMIKSIMGLYPIRSGKLVFDGEDLSNIAAHVRAIKGIAYSPEDSRVFPDLTVEENIKLPIWLTARKDVEDTIESVLMIFPELRKLLRKKGIYCSGGEKKMISIARALAMRPKIVLLDEPFEGLAPLVVAKFGEALKEIENLGISMLIAESNINVAMMFKHRTYVIDRGEIIYNGDVEGIVNNQTVLSVVRGY